MPNGGRLALETSRAERATGAEGTRRPHVVLRMTDTGVGMSAELTARIFDPYFTTKGVGEGSGLGLATVLGIVEQSGGTISVQSAQGEGTTFDIFFPEAAGPSIDLPLRAPCGTQAKGRETILLVEDEAPLRRVLATTLEHFGYRILVAKAPEDALALAETHDGAIDLLLTDVVMPGLRGPDLARRITSLRAETRVLYMSGFTEDAVLRRGVETSDVAFVAKPVTTEALLSKVREVLDRPR
jgi:CheY-like chemotaxis protein